MCIFCEIIAGSLPSYKIYEDEQVFAFLDIKPVHPGHVLVLPKNHAENLEEISPEDLQSLIVIVQKVGRLLKDRLGVSGYNLVVNNGAVAGQVVPHLHFHLVPRLENDGLKLFPQGEYAPGEAEEIRQKLTLGL